MTSLSAEEIAGFAASLDGTLARLWPDARVAGAAGDAMRELWDAAVELGWTDLQRTNALDAALVACGRIGRVACPLPLMDVFASSLLFASLPVVVDDIAGGTIRPVVISSGTDTLRARFLEAAGAATHVVIVVPSTNRVIMRAITNVSSTAGLAKPDWSDVDLANESSAEIDVGADLIDSATALMRLGLVARAVGAAERSLEFSIDYANERTAFGKPIGSFQAVAHRTVDGAVDVTASNTLIREAATAYGAGRESWRLASEVAVEFAGAAAVRAQFGAHHTLAATGYFEEHEMPWLFRRVNADVVKLRALTLSCGEVADVLIESGAGLPNLELGDEAERFREEVREFFEPFDDDPPIEYLDADPDLDLVRAAAARGYLTMAWPRSAGGAEASVEQQMVFGEEQAYRRKTVPGKVAADMLGTAIVRLGTPEQRERILPLMAKGDFRFFLGYSEPETGSDLANMKTSAIRDGNEWIVNGRKMWGTRAQLADWVWLATKTDSDASPPHAGITMFLTRVDKPGFEVQQHRALSGEISCSTFFDEFRISDADRIGEVNGGWKVITEALAQERVRMAIVATTVLRLLDDMLDEIRKDSSVVGVRGSAPRRRISELAARLQAARCLVNASIRATSAVGGGARLEAPMAKIISSLLYEDFCEATLEIFGPAAALGDAETNVPGRGAFEYGLRYSIMGVVGGGTIDIQKNLVARAIGLPR
jgi:alkylation response protein AidB-like acyl-CoA dehydrogenase